jgi:hypothetical protein
MSLLLNLTLLDNRLRFNSAAFVTGYQGKQEDVVFPGRTSGTVAVL